MATGINAHAYDFAATVPSGQTLYFSYTVGGVAVVYPASTIQPVYGWSGYTKPIGDLTIPSSVSHDGNTYAVVAVSNHALYGCSGLASVSIAEGIKAVRQNAMNHCEGMTHIAFPSTLDTLGGSALGNCTGLTTIDMAGAIPYSDLTPFYAIDMANITLNVPCTSYNGYAANSIWSAFGTINATGCYINIEVAANVAEYGYVTGGGTHEIGAEVEIEGVAAEGYHFVCWNDGNTANPRHLTATSDAAFTAFFFAFQHDTTQVVVTETDTVVMHDTTQLVVTQTDTLILHDTIQYMIPYTDTIMLHDTIQYMVPYTDTIIMYDTVQYMVPYTDTIVMHDTIQFLVTYTDTLLVHDTATVYDTVYPTLFRVTVTATDGGTGIGNAILAAGSEVEIGALPHEGYRFDRWTDGVMENPRRITVTGNNTYTATFESTAGIDAVAYSWTVDINGLILTVHSEPGEMIRIFSIDGCLLLQTTPTGQKTNVQLPAAGSYLVQVGQQGGARKVVAR